MENILNSAATIPPLGIWGLFSIFFFGFITAIIAIIPPGLLNMTAAKVNQKEGKRNALFFVFGAVSIIGFQSYFAISFAKIINRRPDLVALLREVGLGIFLTLTIYFFVLAKKPKNKTKKVKIASKSNRFFQGILLSVLNFLPIPYYVFVSVTLASFGWFSFQKSELFLFVFGVIFGSFLVFYGYINFFSIIESKTDYFTKNSNTILGCITALISILTLLNIIQYYW